MKYLRSLFRRWRWVHGRRDLPWSPTFRRALAAHMHASTPGGIDGDD